MIRISAIFGIVSVLTAAIVGGVFIRKKIINDAIYWKAWAEFEENKRRNIRSVEEEINTLQIYIRIQEKDKDNIGKKIEKYGKDMEKLVEEASKHEEKILELKNPISVKKINKINTIIKKQKNLKPRFEKLMSEISKLNSENNNLSLKIQTLKKFLENKKENLKDYAEHRIKLNNNLEDHKSKKAEIEQQKKDLENKLNKDGNLLDELSNLIKKLEESLKEKTLKLFSLKKQKFQSN